jgi:GT2 family glycosyltransferase
MTFPSLTWELNLFFGRSLWYRLLYGKSFTFNYSSKSKEVAYITGADMMVKRHVLEEVGAFNPAFFMYYEETELSYRIQKNGYKIMSVPDAKIMHLEGKSIQTNLSKQQMLLASRKTYYRLTVGKRRIDDAICKYTFWTRAMMCAIKGKQDEKIYWKNSIKLI